MNNEIKLQKVGEPVFNALPKGVYAIVFSNKIIFARRIGGRFVPLSQAEQEELQKKHVVG